MVDYKEELREKAAVVTGSTSGIGLGISKGFAKAGVDLMVVHINSINGLEIPKTAQDILNRVNKVSFNSSFMKAMRVISFVSKVKEMELWLTISSV